LAFDEPDASIAHQSRGIATIDPFRHTIFRVNDLSELIRALIMPKLIIVFVKASHLLLPNLPFNFLQEGLSFHCFRKSLNIFAEQTEVSAAFKIRQKFDVLNNSSFRDEKFSI
jgi:hypothetical protein